MGTASSQGEPSPVVIRRSSIPLARSIPLKSLRALSVVVLGSGSAAWSLDDELRNPDTLLDTLPHPTVRSTDAHVSTLRISLQVLSWG